MMGKWIGRREQVYKISLINGFHRARGTAAWGDEETVEELALSEMTSIRA